MTRHSLTEDYRRQAPWAARALLLAGLALLFLLPAPLRAAGWSVDEPDYAAIDAYIETQMSELNLPGLSLAIVHGDQIVHLRGFGVADQGGRAVTGQTPFGIGSVNKPIIAMGVMQLVDAGRIDLDAPLQRYLPWFQVADPADAARITVRHLLNSTSGISKLAGYHQEDNGDVRDDVLERRVRELSTVSLAHPVGTTFEYCNVCFTTLALVIQQVSGQSFESYMQHQVFAPLAMQQTFTSLVEARRHDMATGYRSWFGKPVPYDLPHDRGGATMYSSAEDLAHFLIAHLNSGRYGSAELVSVPGMAALLAPAVSEGADSPSWSMGWNIGSDRYGLPAIFKEGDLANFHGDVVLIPDGGWGVALLTNGQRTLSGALGNRPNTGITVGVANRLFGQSGPVYQNNSLLLVFAIILLLVVVEALMIVWALITLRRWRQQPARRPQGRFARVWRVALPSVLSLLLAWIFLVGLPILFGGIPLPALRLTTPDVGYTITIAGVVAVIWAIFWPLLVSITLRRAPAVGLATAPSGA
jgi:CubicO group peptidase (beta-lactamase class C family)